MSLDGSAEEQRRQTAAVYRKANLKLGTVWMHYFSIGGDAGELEIDAYLNGSYTLPPIQGDLLAHAVHELMLHNPDGDGGRDE